MNIHVNFVFYAFYLERLKTFQILQTLVSQTALLTKQKQKKCLGTNFVAAEIAASKEINWKMFCLSKKSLLNEKQNELKKLTHVEWNLAK